MTLSPKYISDYIYLLLLSIFAFSTLPTSIFVTFSSCFLLQLLSTSTTYQFHCASTLYLDLTLLLRPIQCVCASVCDVTHEEEDRGVSRSLKAEDYGSTDTD